MPIYEYACRGCGTRFEHMRRTDERLNAPACPKCTGAETMLVMSAPGKVGAVAGGAGAAPMCESGGFGGGGCCGGACMH